MILVWLERSTTWERTSDDKTLRGLDALLSLLPSVGPAERRQRSALLWEALADVKSRRGPRTFVGEYTWRYSHETKTATFDACPSSLLIQREWYRWWPYDERRNPGRRARALAEITRSMGRGAGQRNREGPQQSTRSD